MLLTLVRGSVAPTAALLFVLGAGAGAALEASSEVATEGVSADVAAVSSAVNSTVRRLAGGVGGQVSTILLAVLVLSDGGQPSHAAYVVAFLVSAGITVCGAALVALHRPRRRGGRDHDERQTVRS